MHAHRESLPQNDAPSLAVVAQMKDDEERHAQAAIDAGAIPVPPPAKALMKVAAKVMTTTAHYI